MVKDDGADKSAFAGLSHRWLILMADIVAMVIDG